MGRSLPAPERRGMLRAAPGPPLLPEHKNNFFQKPKELKSRVRRRGGSHRAFGSSGDLQPQLCTISLEHTGEDMVHPSSHTYLGHKLPGGDMEESSAVAGFAQKGSFL